ncbi:prepilin-type N-terminal cleavage/methylation domain-containing protein [Massilia endophytica]|uniref:prepilin-type N-terminal cleavage/methylation domain-containing protein n=1 Tax=Massilia endophytica TaxID=2899220 RepID=UPI001E57C2D1|nr:prepilin-type N-terminal cleavage/methylation domain-containing protein [Massilia endophytica]UGQ48371.1 prepilin-type N-terminal cleavage/methylation domain-containing protein [Massilia endophytica]
MNARNDGFTLIELIVVMVVTGALAAGLVIFLRPAIGSYVAVVNRAELTDLADTAMRTMLRDIRLAVPNSFRAPNTSCFETIPTSTGGRYRSDADTTSTQSAPVDTSAATTSFDVISPLTTVPSAGDWIVVANQNTNDVYAGVNRAAIASVTAPPAATPALGQHRITLATAMQFPIGYDSSRFVVVPNSQQAVFYSCSNLGVDAKGNGTGVLYRFSQYGFNAATPVACPAANAATPVVATGLSQCTFTLNPNPGAIQGAGYVELKLRLTVNNESVDLVFGAHTDNLP